MAKKVKKKAPAKAKDVGAPVSLVTLVFAGFPALALILAGEVWSGSGQVTGAMTYSVLLALGLCLCFYWRRLRPSRLKSFAVALYQIQNFTFLIVYVISYFDFLGPQDVVVPLSVFSLLFAAMIGISLVLKMATEVAKKKRPLAFVIGFFPLFLGAFFFASQFQLATLKLPQDEPLSEEFVLSPEDSEMNLEKPRTNSVESAMKVSSSDIGNIDDPALSQESGSWSYFGSEGPSFWGDLSSENTACSEGKLQSPINILPRSSAKSKKINSLERRHP